MIAVLLILHLWFCRINFQIFFILHRFFLDFSSFFCRINFLILLILQAFKYNTIVLYLNACKINKIKKFILQKKEEKSKKNLCKIKKIWKFILQNHKCRINKTAIINCTVKLMNRAKFTVQITNAYTTPLALSQIFVVHFFSPNFWENRFRAVSAYNTECTCLCFFFFHRS